MEELKNKFVEEEATQEIENAITNEQNAIPYTPLSKLPSMGTVIPLNLAGETLQAQFKVSEDIEDTDAYLVNKLAYTSKYALSQALSAEQADAVALAIRQIEKGKGFILADMAGIGKGRVNAAVLRFAFVNGYLPIFITEKPNLFSAMYRDILDIGGIETKPSGKINAGYPLILNGYKSGGREKTLDESGKKITIIKPSETGIINADGKEVITAPKQVEIKTIIKGNKIPKDYDYVDLTYSQLSGPNGKGKFEYLKRVIDNLDGKVVLCMDEAHNAAGVKSDVGKSMSEIVARVKGVLFSSATFSKRPDNMYIYSLKTDVSDSPLGTKKLIEVIQEGGERLTENLASNLVASQQMLRRERTFENCNVEYNYMSDDEKTELFEKYDTTIKLYQKLLEFFSNNNTLFYNAKIKAVQKFAESKGVELILEKQPKDAKEAKAWRKANEGKYRLAGFSAGEITRSQFQFIETLLFALKADFVANQTLSQLLNDKLENLTVTKVPFLSNRKPVIAVRSTLESVYYNLGLEVGQELDKADFSMYVYSLAAQGLSGAITLKEIQEEKDGKKIEDDIEIENSDFEDGGKFYNKLLEEINGINLDIPLSPIDYIIQKIETTRRPQWDMAHGEGSEFFKVGEVTGRKFTLLKQADGKYKLETNQKPKNKGTTFKKFNSGFYDVLLINESGSTGEDAHSSAKFSDQRPRVMIIHQVELDVNTEVQKRGRINRTGQVNYPNYIYAVSRIPSEIRRLLMLVRKLRSLDANTTANQKQSSKLSAIRDSFGNEIQDVINKYGDEVLEEFLSVAENEKYKNYLPTDDQQKINAMTNGFIIETFVKNLELSLCEEQEYFYNTVNALYTNLVDAYKEAGIYDLETNIVDLKASIKNRMIISKGVNTNAFNTPVYEEDDYVLAEDKPYTKEKYESLIQELAKGQDPEQFYQEFLSDYKAHLKVILKEVAQAVKVPDYTLAKDEMDKMQMEAEYNLKVKSALNRAEEEHQAVLDIIEARDKKGNLIFKPNKAAVIPAVPEECYETDLDGNPIVPKEYNNAKFVGVRILKTAKEKYSPMNIELIFAQLSGKPKLILKPTAKGREVLYWVIQKSEDIERFRLVLIDNWEVDPNKRNLIRLMTGNILGAYGIAKERVARDNFNYSPVINFLKFTTADNNSIRLGIKLNMKKFQPLMPKYVPVEYPLNSSDLIPDIMKTDNWIRSRNDAENFYLEIDRNKNLQVFVFGGTSTPTKAKEKKYYSKLYNDGKFVQLINDSSLYFRYGDIKYTPIGASRGQKLVYKGFSCNMNGKEDEIKQLFDYIFSETPFNISISGVENEETIVNKGDLYVPDLPEVEIEREGIFAYNTLRPYDSIKDSIDGFNKFNNYVKTSPFGTVYLKRRANIKESISYGLIPLDNSIVDMVSDTFQALTSDAEKIKLKEDISKAIISGKSNFEIGMIVNKALNGKVISTKNIFGYEADNLDYVGDVFVRYTKGEIELPEKGKKEEDGVPEEYKIEKRPLSLDTAEEFLILFSYKIKN
jgi:hypothetical protein